MPITHYSRPGGAPLLIWRDCISFNALQELFALARQYAAIMASLGMTIVLMRALRNGNAFEATLVSALFWMVTLGFIGFMVASLARTTIDEAVRQRMEDELNNVQNAATAAATT